MSVVKDGADGGVDVLKEHFVVGHCWVCVIDHGKGDHEFLSGQCKGFFAIWGFLSLGNDGFFKQNVLLIVLGLLDVILLGEGFIFGGI